MDLAVDSERRDRAIVVRLAGDFDLHSSAEVRGAVDGLLDEEGIDEVFLDLDGVTFLDSSGLGTLVGLQKHANRARVRLVLCGLSAQADKILDITHLRDAFTILPEVPASEAPHPEG
jgi:anti-anti-sigma factor